MHNIFLFQEEGAEVRAAGCQNSLVGFKVHTVHNKGTVTQQTLPALSVQLLQNLPAVPREVHHLESLGTVLEAGTLCGPLTNHKCHIIKIAKERKVSKYLKYCQLFSYNSIGHECMRKKTPP